MTTYERAMLPHRPKLVRLSYERHVRLQRLLDELEGEVEFTLEPRLQPMGGGCYWVQPQSPPASASPTAAQALAFPAVQLFVERTAANLGQFELAAVRDQTLTPQDLNGTQTGHQRFAKTQVIEIIGAP